MMLTSSDSKKYSIQKQKQLGDEADIFNFDLTVCTSTGFFFLFLVLLGRLGNFREPSPFMEIKSAIAADEPAFRNRPLSLAGRVIRGPSRVIQKAARPLKLAGSNDIISQGNCIMFSSKFQPNVY